MWISRWLGRYSRTFVVWLFLLCGRRALSRGTRLSVGHDYRTQLLNHKTFALFLASISQLHIDLPSDITFIASPWLSSILQMGGWSISTAHQSSAGQTRTFEKERRSLSFSRSIRHPSKCSQRNLPYQPLLQLLKSC